MNAEERARFIDIQIMKFGKRWMLNGVNNLRQFLQGQIEEAEQAALEEGRKAKLICGYNKGVENTRIGCGQMIFGLDDLYRCADCSTAMHKTCLKQHFGEPGYEKADGYKEKRACAFKEGELKGQREMRDKICAILPTWSEDAVSCGERNNKKHKPVCHYETVVSIGRRIEAIPLTTRGGENGV